MVVALGSWAYVQQRSGNVAAPPPAEEAAGDLAAALVTDALLQRERGAAEGAPWRVTEANSTDTIMVVDIEAERPDEALDIAEEIVAPLANSYEEVLIYVRAYDRTTDTSVRRIRWTPNEGYVETTYSEQ
jgi:hypothetical protein